MASYVHYSYKYEQLTHGTTEHTFEGTRWVPTKDLGSGSGRGRGRWLTRRG